MTTRLHRARLLVCVFTLLASAAGAVGPAAHRAAATPAVYNGKIAFTTAGEAPQIKTVNPDGSSEALLIDDVGIATYSADGSQIAYYGPTGLSVMHADGTNRHEVLPGEGDGFLLSWSPDGSRFMFQTHDDANEEAIAIINADGSDRHLILDDNDAGEWDPTWSPNGEQIIYWSESDWGWEVWIVDADGTDPHRAVVTPPGMPAFPSFSRDGSKLLFSFDPEGEEEPQRLYVANADGSDLHAVGPAGAGTPTFSPDGQWIAFAGGSSAETEGLYVMRIDGSELKQITHGYDILPKWQPLSEAPNVAPRAIGTVKEKLALKVFGNAEASNDPDGMIVSYEWRWGDNTPMTSSKYAWHRYAKPGTYLVRLTVTDDKGAKTTRKAWFRVVG